jgi:sugar lactone lactonase YvrE
VEREQTGPAKSQEKEKETVSNQKYTETEISAQALALPCHADTEDNGKTADVPILPEMADLPITADLPILPEFQHIARQKRSAGWRGAFAAAGTAAVLVIASVGCGMSGSTMQNSSTTTTAPALDKALWVANGTNVVEFIPSQLTAGNTDPAPHLSINSSVFGAPQGVTFDAMGNLWVIDGGTVAAGGTMPPALFEFTVAQLNALGTNNTPMPKVTINSASFTFPQQAVFDPNGNLWVSDNGSNAIFVLTPAQLAASSANLSPTVSIASNPALQGPLGIVFDAKGDLYIANNASTTIFKFNNNILPKTAGSYTLTPSSTLSDDGNGSIQAPWALAFDTNGDLWSSNANPPNTIVEFTPSQLVATGSPTPAITLSSVAVGTNQTLAAPNGIAFDNLGDLAAISSAAPFGVAGFQKAQLIPAASGPAPNPFLVGATTTLNAPAGCNFGPVVN